jgi:alkylhydroperoxidase/carboxymuconolactone decarboxylase family protein YurZ
MMLTPKDPPVSQGVIALDADFGAMAARVGAETWSIEGLSPQDCALLCIVNDVCNRTLSLPFQMHVQLMITNGARFRQIKEILLHLAPHAGFPLVLEALLRLKELQTTLQVDDNDEGVSGEAETQSWDEEESSRLLALDENFGRFVMRETNYVWSRGILSAKERVYISLAVDVIYQTLGEPFRFHLQQALQQGVSIDQVKAVIRFLEEFSMVRAWEAFSALQAHLQMGI